MTKTKLDIFSYTDYRAFLRDRLDELKQANTKYSRRYLIRRLGLANSNYLKMIIDGVKPLSERLLAKLVPELGLSPDEGAFWAALARFGQATTQAEKAQHLAELRRWRRFRTVHAVDLSQLDYMTDPVALALRELCALPDFTEDPTRLAARLALDVTPKQVEAALARLVELGVLVRDEDGLRQAHKHQSSGHLLGSLPLRLYHQHMLDEAKRSVDQPVERRAFSGLTFAVSSPSYEKILARYAAFLDEVRVLIDEETEWNEVYHLETVLFPLTNPLNGERRS